MKEKIQALYKSIMPYINLDGKNTTPVSYIDVYRCMQKEMILPDIPNPYLFFVVHGKMRLHSTRGIFEYKAGQYLISAIDSPRAAEISSDLQTYPFIALLIEFSVDDVISVMLDIDGDLPEKLFDETAAAAMPPCTDEKMTEILIRLLNMNIRRKTESLPAWPMETAVTVYYLYNKLENLSELWYSYDEREYDNDICTGKAGNGVKHTYMLDGAILQ